MAADFYGVEHKKHPGVWVFFYGICTNSCVYTITPSCVSTLWDRMSESGSDTVEDDDVCYVCKSADADHRYCSDCEQLVCDDCIVYCGCEDCQNNERWTCITCAPDMADCHVCGMEDLACDGCDPTIPSLHTHPLHPCCCYHTHIEDNHPDAYGVPAAGSDAASQINMESLVF